MGSRRFSTVLDLLLSFFILFCPARVTGAYRYPNVIQVRVIVNTLIRGRRMLVPARVPARDGFARLRPARAAIVTFHGLLAILQVVIRAHVAAAAKEKIGRASCRERV